jgi:hypothetical protein
VNRRRAPFQVLGRLAAQLCLRLPRELAQHGRSCACFFVFSATIFDVSGDGVGGDVCGGEGGLCGGATSFLDPAQLCLRLPRESAPLAKVTCSRVFLEVMARLLLVDTLDLDSASSRRWVADRLSHTRFTGGIATSRRWTTRWQGDLTELDSGGARLQSGNPVRRLLTDGLQILLRSRFGDLRCLTINCYLFDCDVVGLLVACVFCFDFLLAAGSVRGRRS